MRDGYLPKNNVAMFIPLVIKDEGVSKVKT